jgi:hypothetical protein
MELVFPKLVDTASGQSRIRDTSPTLFHEDASGGTDYQAMCRDVPAKYRDTLSDDRRVLFDRYRGWWTWR